MYFWLMRFVWMLFFLSILQCTLAWDKYINIFMSILTNKWTTKKNIIHLIVIFFLLYWQIKSCNDIFRLVMTTNQNGGNWIKYKTSLNVYHQSMNIWIAFDFWNYFECFFRCCCSSFINWKSMILHQMW